MNILREKIKKIIAQKGPITFEAFMRQCLYEPELGYYMSSHTEIGRAGDYYTSPHLHPLFGVMLGRQIEEMLELMAMPNTFSIIEMGAGKGYLCKDMLEYLKDREFFKAINYIIVELNPFMIKRQNDLLHLFLNKVTWLSSLSELNGITGCFLSNELLDSFPVHIVEMDDELKEVYVSLKGEELIEIKKELSTLELSDYFRDFSIRLPSHYRTEINLRIKAWLKDIYTAFKEGFIITIDYGYPAWQYYSEERGRGTLLCYKGHNVSENPYEDIGYKDITSHVNFSSLKLWGEEMGLKTLGFCSQGSFLVSLGIDELITKLYGNSKDYLFEVAKIKGLILPGTMGESHKVMIQYKGKEGSQPTSLRGFSLKNQVKTL